AWHRHRLLRLLGDAEAAVAAWSGDKDPARLRKIARHQAGLRKVRRHLRRPVAPAAEVPRRPGLLRESVRALGSRELLLNAARTSISAALAGWFALALGFGHPLWASMAAVAALQGLTFHTTVQRGIQRLAGNVLGAAIAAGLIALALDYWQAVAAIVLLQAAAELLVIRNYLLLSMAITPMVLLLTGLGGRITAEAAVSRVADTLVGVVVGVAVAAVTISLSDRHHLAVRPARHP
ncbi:FUSC family protein, partial [Arthrobacter sp. GCM10027362]|uniref:FUSC family protein n=1 Tax=Arthrobacter sp. GCM10027362 TaxID=3273379 RepID=UPI003629576E